MNITGPMAAGPQGPPDTPGPLVFVSLPHFCDADPALLADVEGLQCDRDKHVTYVDVEPTTGAHGWPGWSTGHTYNHLFASGLGWYAILWSVRWSQQTVLGSDAR